MLKQLRQITRKVVLIVAISVAGQAYATSIEQIDFDELTEQAVVIFEAEVVGVQSRWNSQASAIHTYIDFAVTDVIKGNAVPAGVRLTFLGGQVAEQEMRVEGMVYPGLGERGIYFLSSLQAEMVNPLLGWSQGHYKLDENDFVMSSAGRAISRDLSANQSTRKTLSTGVARGLKQDSETGMRKVDFKRQITLILERDD